MKWRQDGLRLIRRGLRIRWNDAWYAKNMRWLSSYAYHPWLGYVHRYEFPFSKVCNGEWPARSATPLYPRSE